MNIDLSGKAILVTGAASGIGLAIARAAAAASADVFLTDRDRTGLDRAMAELDAPGCVAELADPSARAAIAGAAVEFRGRIDGLVNAAGLTTRASFVDGTQAIWDELFAVNARAAFFLMQAAIADMRRRAAPGVIVNILSVNAPCGLAELAIYSATKGALTTLTRNAANAHLAERIRVNGINLGWVATPSERHMQAHVLDRGEGWEAEAAARLPLGRLIEAEEAARLAVFLLSEASAPMTGSVVDFEQRVAGAIG